MKTKNNEIEYLKKVRELLITIDMVNGFVKEGTLAAPSIKRIIQRQVELIKEALEKSDVGIVFVRDAHTKDAIEFKTYPEHCLIGSKESELIDELKPFEKDAMEYLKNSTNLIFAPNMQSDLLKLLYLEKVRLMGCLSEVCVLNGAVGLRTFFDQNNRNVDVLVHADAIDTYDTKDHVADEITKKALIEMQNNGIKILRKEK